MSDNRPFVQVFDHVIEARVNIKRDFIIDVRTDIDGNSFLSIHAEEEDQDINLELLDKEDLIKFGNLCSEVGKFIDRYVNKDLYNEDEYHG